MLKDITVNGIVLKVEQVETNIQRPTIIFLHDSLGCIALWRDFPFRLGEVLNCNVVIYDRQGYGQSGPFSEIKRDNDYLEKEADILHELISTLKLKEVILFGHSDGASISLLTVAKYPTAIKGIIIEGAHIFVEEITLKGISQVVNLYESTDLSDKLKKYHGNKTEDVFKAWTETWLSTEFRSWNIEHFLKAITCPVLVIQGENDEYGSLKQVNGIVDQVSGTANKFIIPEIGHTPHKEAAEKVLEASVSFFNKLY